EGGRVVAVEREGELLVVDGDVLAEEVLAVTLRRADGVERDGVAGVDAVGAGEVVRPGVGPRPVHDAVAHLADAEGGEGEAVVHEPRRGARGRLEEAAGAEDRKSTRLNSSHVKISYAVFCLKKKKKYQKTHI